MKVGLPVEVRHLRRKLFNCQLGVPLPSVVPVALVNGDVGEVLLKLDDAP